MNKITKTIAATFFLAIFITTLVAAPFTSRVLAHQGEDDNDTSVSSDDSRQSSEPTLKDDNLSDDKDKIQSKIQALRAEAKTKIEDKRKNHETLTAEKRTKVCENRKTAINNKLTTFTTSAEKHLTRLNAIHGKIVAFQDRKQIVLTNNDSLTADISAKKQAATEATAALAQVTGDVDCSDPDAATTLRTARDAAHSARTALHNYRVSLKNLVSAITETQSDSIVKKAE